MRPDSAPRTTERTVSLRRLLTPWTLIPIITGFFQLYRDAPIDAVFFFAVAAVLIADALNLLRFKGTGQPSLAVLLVAAAVLGTLMVFAPRHGVMEGLIVSAIGLTVLVFGWQSYEVPTAMTTAMRRAAILWSAVGVIGCVWEIASFVLGMPSDAAAAAHPSISLLLDPFLDTLLGRIVFTVLWLLLGITLVRRGRR